MSGMPPNYRIDIRCCYACIRGAHWCGNPYQFVCLRFDFWGADEIGTCDDFLEGDGDALHGFMCELEGAFLCRSWTRQLGPHTEEGNYGDASS